MRCGRIHRQRTVLFDDEVLDYGAFAKAAEDAPVTACDRLVADDVQVLDMMGVSVELARKSITFRHRGIIAVPRGGGESHRCPGRNFGEIDICQKVHPTFGILPLESGGAGIHSLCESDKISSVRNTVHLPGHSRHVAQLAGRHSAGAGVSRHYLTALVSHRYLESLRILTGRDRQVKLQRLGKIDVAVNGKRLVRFRCRSACQGECGVVDREIACNLLSSHTGHHDLLYNCFGSTDHRYFQHCRKRREMELPGGLGAAAQRDDLRIGTPLGGQCNRARIFIDGCGIHSLIRGRDGFAKGELSHGSILGKGRRSRTVDNDGISCRPAYLDTVDCRTGLEIRKGYTDDILIVRL